MYQTSKHKSTTASLQRKENVSFFSPRQVIQRDEAPRTEPRRLPTPEEQREELCIGITPGEGPERFTFNDRQRHILRIINSSAGRVISMALTALNVRDRYVQTLANSIFGRSDLRYTFFEEKIRQIREKLENATFEGGTCYDESCYSAGVVAHAIPESNTIVLCRAFFRLNTTQMRRTLIHEAAHNAGIDEERVNEFKPEFYCREDTSSCHEVCNNLTDPLKNVDAWAHFIECVAFSF